MSSERITKGRMQLATVLKQAGDVVRIDDVVETLSLTRTEASKRLSRWAEQGWLRRVGKGAYVAASLDLLDSQQVLDDPWVLVPTLFGPAYIGGRTAAEHWDLTEQVFNDIVVFTQRPVRARTQRRHGAAFTLKQVREKHNFGTKPLWRHATKIQLSDVQKTIIDMLDDPAIGGGIQHVNDCLANYLRQYGGKAGKLIEYGERLGNGAVFKRLGFLAERDPLGAEIAQACRQRLTKGNAKLDSALECPRLLTRWRLFVPESWRKAGEP
jgi:predicted transcriptional regulator of viral defense system